MRIKRPSDMSSKFSLSDFVLRARKPPSEDEPDVISDVISSSSSYPVADEKGKDAAIEMVRQYQKASKSCWASPARVAQHMISHQTSLQHLEVLSRSAVPLGVTVNGEAFAREAAEIIRTLKILPTRTRKQQPVDTSFQGQLDDIGSRITAMLDTYASDWNTAMQTARETQAARERLIFGDKLLSTPRRDKHRRRKSPAPATTSLNSD
ncbi:hypothetical protein TI39_contig347g00015 [Zymoseptoria brevis]|uniref:Uncharacterized protein n=1 Tax=Zymoseptoria brevis TaxID=1047168 RepID=A0A0F4GRA8_9PEZI|nr:hypothetical protein TI39_contig347g00015 [Zymoseptoria brevis]